jgi:hypothetical protein
VIEGDFRKGKEGLTMQLRTRITTLAVALVAAGCASTYQLTLMPRDSGKIYYGVVDDTGGGEGRMSVEIDGKTYSGTWVQVSAERSSGFVSGGWGWGGRRGGLGLGTMITLDNPQGGEAKALLQAPDGSGLRCDFRSGQGRGGGLCRDDRGREYDVQIRPAERR